MREALRSLEASGVITLRTGKGGGAYVSSGSPSAVSASLTDLFYLQQISIENLTEARIEIEDAVVRLACRRATAEDLALLDANIDAAMALHRQGRLQEKAAMNIEFHNLLAAASKNPRSSSS